MTMKFLIAALILVQASAFTFMSNRAQSRLVRFAEYEPLEGEGKINLKVGMLNKELGIA